MSERRTAPRMNVSLEAVWEGTAGRYVARVSDISLSGCYMDTIGESEVGALIGFRFQLPGGDWLSLRAQVVHYQRTVGMGLRFTSLTRDEETKIRELLGEQYAPVEEINALSSEAAA